MTEMHGCQVAPRGPKGVPCTPRPLGSAGSLGQHSAFAAVPIGPRDTRIFLIEPSEPLTAPPTGVNHPKRRWLRQTPQKPSEGLGGLPAHREGARFPRAKPAPQPLEDPRRGGSRHRGAPWGGPGQHPHSPRRGPTPPRAPPAPGSQPSAVPAARRSPARPEGTIGKA